MSGQDDIVLRAMVQSLSKTVIAAGERADALAVGSRYVDNIAAFGLDAFGIRLWEAQVAIARSIAARPKTAVKSGHRIGKSLMLALLAWWWASTRAAGKVILTSTTDRQVRGIIWSEVRHLWTRRRGVWKTLPEPALAPSTGIRWGDGRSVKGFTARQPEGMQGFAGSDLLILVDEGSGVPDNIFDAIEGNLAGGGKLGVFTNPTRAEGYVYDAFHKNAADFALHTVRSLDTPNARSGRRIIPGLAEKDWCEGRARDWGLDSARYAVRVLGEFPDQSDNTIIAMSLVEEAKQRWLEWEENGWTSDSMTLFAGMDPARHGDDEATWVFRDGMRMDGLEAHLKMNMTDFCDRFVEEAEGRRIGRRVVVRVDTGGLGGGWADYLRKLHLDWLVVEEVNASSTSSDPSKYFNLRAELWFGMADFLKAGGGLPPDDELDRELGTVRYEIKNRGDIGQPVKVEAKDEIKKAIRLGKSPGRADCCTLAAWRWDSGDYAGGGNVVWGDEDGDDDGGYRSGDQRGFG